MNTLLYIFAFIGVWYCLSLAVLLALWGIAEGQRELRGKAQRVAEGEWRDGTD